MKSAGDKKNLAHRDRWDSASRKLIGQIELLQMRVAAAEETWKQSKEQFSQAKRRRKLAKLFARRAKKDAKRAGQNLDLARKALADAKAQAMTVSWRAASQKVTNAKEVPALSKKRATPKRSARKTPLARSKSVSHKHLATIAAPAESIPGNPDPAVSSPTTPPGEARAIA